MLLRQDTELIHKIYIMIMKQVIYVIDFGSQYSQLIARRVRELGVYSELVPYTTPLAILKKSRGIILSGGPNSVYEKNAPTINKKIFDLDVPILGICYGLQLIAHTLGGKVELSQKREYGPALITTKRGQKLFAKLPRRLDVWMSHGDHVTRLPSGFAVSASTPNAPYAAVAHASKPIYGIQFHPEVSHTPRGNDILANFLFGICSCRPSWKLGDFIEEQISSIKKSVGDAKVISAISGGVDSSVATTLVHRAIGNQLTAVFVDNGMLRAGERDEVKAILGRSMHIPMRTINARLQFLRKLKGVISPEKKRKNIGRTFIKVFEQVSRDIQPRPDFLVQGTLYPDVIESAYGKKGGVANIIKSHHNVGGLPKNMKLKLIEPLRDLFKDEVRTVGELLGLPHELVWRQPFPGPGLAVRIIGEVTPARLKTLRHADQIVREEIIASNLYRDLWQFFAVLLPEVRSVGVQGDARTYAHPVILRAVTSSDVMTVDWARLPDELLECISTRITNEVRGINRVLYDITPKPPGTVEWE